MRDPVLLPLYAMIVLTSGVLLRLAWLRVGGIRRRETRVTYYRTMQGEPPPEHVIATGRNFSNLFEMPVLFYLAVLLVHVDHLADPAIVALAWAYVAFRTGHSAIHLTFNDVQSRFTLFVLSNVVLAVLWLMVAWREA
jgi:hypothetical protein